MKETPGYEPIPHEQILAARQTDLAAYLTARGEQLIPAGRSYRMADHDSLVITDNMFSWNSRKISGNSLDFLRCYYQMGFREAVMELTSGGGGGVEKKILLSPAPEKPFEFTDIELSPSLERVIAYLTKTRGLSRRLIDELIIDRRLFQEAKTNNAIFPIYENRHAVGAEVQGTLSYKRFKGIKPGSKYGCGYNLTFGDKTAYALFFESAIDLLSFVEVSRLNGKGMEGCRLTSMMGLKENIVEHTLQALPEGTQPFLCVDNDEAGTNFAQQMGLNTRLPEPDYKDWNEQLLAMRQA